MLGEMICLFVMFVVGITAMVVLTILHSKDCKNYEKLLKAMKKQVTIRDNEIELQKFVIQTQSKMIEELRS